MILKVYLSVKRLSNLMVFITSENNRIDDAIEIDWERVNSKHGDNVFATVKRVGPTGKVVLNLAETYRKALSDMHEDNDIFQVSERYFLELLKIIHPTT